MIHKIFNLFIEPKVLTPIVCVLLVTPVQNISAVFVIIVSIITALVGGFYEVQDNDIDTHEFSLIEMREKRYLLLSIGMLFFWISSVIDSSSKLTMWSHQTFALVSLFLAVTVILRQRFSAHTLFLFVNFAGIYIYSPSVFIHIVLVVLLIIVARSRVQKDKHTYTQILATCIICLPYYLMFVV